MSNVVTLRLPESLYERIKKMAKDEGISLNQYAQLALAEKLAREETLQLLEGRFNALEKSLKAADLMRSLEFTEMFTTEMRRVTRRYQAIEREARRFTHLGPD